MKVRVAVGLCLIVVVVVALLHFTGTPACSQKQPYKIGAVFSVTGGASFLGNPEKKQRR